MNEYYDLFYQYALNNDNYKRWRNEHKRVFRDIFSSAFADNEEAQIHLTAALINISMREFAEAIPKLDLLESFCVNEFDEAAIYYFKGLNYELLGNEQEMIGYYEKVRASDISFVFPLTFHPYYRTAKFAQRDMESKKALFYYKKALEFYDGTVPNVKETSTVSQIIYDIATICLYIHNYEDCEKFLKLSKIYDSSENQQRNYVTAILYAVQGKRNECNASLREMNSFFKVNCEPMVNSILGGLDPHYCVVPQDRTSYNSFWISVSQSSEHIETLLRNGDIDKAQTIISKMLSDAFCFMKRNIDCRIQNSEHSIIVYCKNYSTKTLISEYDALFAKKPMALEKWRFVAVETFENF